MVRRNGLSCLLPHQNHRGGGLIYVSKLPTGPSSSAGPQNPSLDTTHQYWSPLPLDDDNVVHRSGDESIGGVKTHTTTLKVMGEKYTIDPSTGPNGIQNPDNDANLILWSGFSSVSDGQGGKLCIYGNNCGETTKGAIALIVRNPTDGTNNFTVYPDGNSVLMKSGGPNMRLRNPNLDKSVAVQSSWGGSYSIDDKNGDIIASITHYCGTTLSEIDFSVHLLGTTSQNTSVTLRTSSGGTHEFMPSTGNSVSLGSSGRKWTTVYATNGTIQTSDERFKSTITPVPDNVLDAWESVNFIQYQFNDALQEKGSAARFHNGLIAQNIDNIFKSNNLDASRYGLFCYDEWDAEPERKDNEGNVVQPASPAGNQYSLRYEEALCMEAAYQRRENRRMKEKVASLEERLASLEEKLK